MLVKLKIVAMLWQQQQGKSQLVFWNISGFPLHCLSCSIPPYITQQAAPTRSSEHPHCQRYLVYWIPVVHRLKTFVTLLHMNFSFKLQRRVCTLLPWETQIYLYEAININVHGVFWMLFSTSSYTAKHEWWSNFVINVLFKLFLVSSSSFPPSLFLFLWVVWCFLAAEPHLYFSF